MFVKFESDEHKPEAAWRNTVCVEGPVEWVRKNLRFEPDAQQIRVLESTSKNLIMNCTRQWGKSTITAAKAVYLASTVPETLIVAVSPSLRQTAEFVRKAEVFVSRMGIKPKGDGTNEVSIQFANGSRLVGLPGTEATVRGFSAVSLAIVDEAARVPDELYNAIRPMLAVSDGAMWLMSTPFVKRGFFYDVWSCGGELWDKIQVKAEDCPRISKEFLAREKRMRVDRQFRQEYCCEFADVKGQVFDMEMVRKAIDHSIPPLFPELNKGPIHR